MSFRSVKRARQLHRFSAEHFMRLCAFCGIDPATGEDCGQFQAGPVLWWFLGIGLAVRRNLLGLTVTKAAKRIGVSHATASRAEAGKAVSIESFLLICKFAGIDPRDCVYCFDHPQNVFENNNVHKVDKREALATGAAA